MSLTTGQSLAAVTATAKMDSALEVMMQDANGSDAYNNTKVMMGHIEAGKFLMIPDAFDAYCATVPTLAVDLRTLGAVNGIENYTGLNAVAYCKANPLMTIRPSTPVAPSPDAKLITLKIVAMNYKALLAAGVGETAAAYAAMLRANWCMRGAYLTVRNDSTMTNAEHVIVSDSHATLGGINSATDQAAIAAELGTTFASLASIMSDADAGAQWVTLYAQNIWCAVEHVFRVRSHHYKSTGNDAKSYEELYTKYLNACFIGNSTWPAGLDKFAIFHTAIHPFRIHSLPICAAHFVAHGLVADAAIIRFSGAPCGNAVLTTTEAALSTLASELWYPGFAQAYATPIKTLSDATQQVLGAKYEYHIAAALYGVEHKTSVDISSGKMSVDTIKTNTSMLASAGNGLISALSQVKGQNIISSFALSNARALEKPAASNPMLSLKVSQIILASINALDDASDMTKLLKSILPPIDG